MTGPVTDPTPTIKPTRPAVVGALRGAIEAGAVAAIGVLVAFLTALDLGAWNVAIPAVVAAARIVEGWIDDKVDPTVQRGRLGGGPAPITSKPAG